MSIVAVSTDLMDRSKITAAFDDVRVVRPGADLSGADVILVDLALDVLDDAVATGARVLAYGSHVDDESLAAAGEAGAEAMPRSRFFRKLADGTLIT
ncbi:MAG: hypothetical protein U5K30_10750 [Acidimicrobiales bacterium]|nr:hypothetical protein [Acidimicrobiales bacterium]